MAALTSAGVTINSIYKSEGTSGRYYKVLDVTLTLSSQGGLTNSVGADLFGLQTIEGSSGFRDSSSVAVYTGPSYDKSKLVFYTIETNGNPADKSATYRGVVWGLEAV